MTYLHVCFRLLHFVATRIAFKEQLAVTFNHGSKCLTIQQF
jgi:hypothetical protein